MPTIVCPKCGSDKLRFSVSLFINAPIEKYRRLSKTALKSKDVEIWGADWPNAEFVCKKCGYGWDRQNLR